MSQCVACLGAGESFEHFVDRVVRPPTDFKNLMSQTVEKIVTHLHQIPELSIQEIVKGGSLGKGTAVKKNADLDLFVYLNKYETVEKLMTSTPEILAKIKDHMMKIPRVIHIEAKRTTPFHTEYRILPFGVGQTNPKTIKVDLVLATDVLKQHDGDFNALYQEMKTKGHNVREHYSPCLAKSQVDLIKSQPAKVKDLAKLFKFWKTKNCPDMKSYFCEILAVDLYQNHLQEKSDFKLKDGFHKGLEMLSDYNGLALNIGDKYNIEDWRSDAPCAVDPVNPFMNISSSKVSQIEKKAKTTLYELGGIQRK